tara:strand:+ start:728 stop:1576 length:849 start_codon:yes stop_codon:yes gene_type:complete
MKIIILILLVILGAMYYIDSYPGEKAKLQEYYQQISIESNPTISRLVMQDTQVTISFISKQSSRPFANSDLRVEITNTSEIVNKSAFIYNEMTNDAGSVILALKTDVGYKISVTEGLGRARIYPSSYDFVVSAAEQDYTISIDERASLKPTQLYHYEYPIKHNETIVIPGFIGREMWEFEIYSAENGIIKCPALKLNYTDSSPHIWKKSSINIKLPDSSQIFPNNEWVQMSDVLYPTDYAVLILQFDDAKSGEAVLMIDDVCGLENQGNEPLIFSMVFNENT